MENLGFNIFDAVVVGLIILLSIKGLLSGFTKELFNAIGLIGGLFVASYYKTQLATYLHDNFLGNLSMPLLELISLLTIFIAIFIVAKLISKIIDSVSSNDYISAASRLGGMLIKMITLFFIFSLIVFGLSSKPQVVNNFKDTLQSSKLYPLLKNSGALILNTQSEMLNSTNEVKESNTTKEESKNQASEANTTTNKEQKEDNTTIATEHNSTKANNKEQETKEIKDTNSSSAEVNSTKEANETNSTN